MASSRIQVQPPRVPKILFPLYPYQVRWIQDKSRLKIATKARRIGFSFAEGLDCIFDCIEHRTKRHIILSRSERLSEEFITEAVAPHICALGILATITKSYIPGTSVTKHEVTFANGSRIIALPANPDTARSYEGDVTLDEFGFHQDPRAIYQAIAPSITRGYTLRIISTPNGQQGAYFELANEAGLVDGHKRSARWSAHRCTILEAIAHGCKDRFGNPLNAAEIRATCLDEEMWLQEYMCQFLSSSRNGFPQRYSKPMSQPTLALATPSANIKNLSMPVGI